MLNYTTTVYKLVFIQTNTCARAHRQAFNAVMSTFFTQLFSNYSGNSNFSLASIYQYKDDIKINKYKSIT